MEQRKLKKFLALSLALLLTIPALSACGSKETLRVYNAAEYMDEKAIKEFEKETGIKIVYDTFDDNENMYAKVSHDENAYDVVIPSDYMIDCLIQEDRLQKLDLTKIPNFANISDEYKNPVYDSQNEYTVPYMVGTLGILYNTTMVEEEVNSWEILFDEKYAGNIYMLDSMRDAICVALKALGYSANDSSDESMAAAQEKLIAQKPILQAYITDEIKDKMVLGEGALALTYSGEARIAMDENEDLAYAVPDEGSNKWADGFVVLKGCKNPEAAYKFIDFMCRKDIAQRNMDETGYTSPISGGLDVDLTDEVRYPTQEVLAKCEAFLYDANLTAKLSSVWEKVKAQ